MEYLSDEQFAADMNEGIPVEGEVLPGPKALDQEELGATLASYYQASESFIDEDLGPERAELTRYYRGEKFGNEVEGRSQVVSTDVRDTVGALMPSLMRIFFGPQKVLEFVPQTPQDVPVAEQMTDYVDYIVRQDNPGFLTFWGWFKDALVRRVGVVKVWWDERQRVTETEVSGLTEETLAMLQAELANDPSARLDLGSAEDGTLYGTVTRTGKEATVKFRVVPPEEFLVHPESTLDDGPRYCAHRTVLTVGDLVAMGYDFETVVEHAEGGGVIPTWGEEDIDRAERTGAREYGVTGEDEASRPVIYVEHFVKIDTDGDGIAELRKICTIGQHHHILSNETVDDHPFVFICPDPEPHEFFGLGTGDLTKDIQLVKSSIMRHMLDSLAQTVIPKYGVVEGQVNMSDVLNDEIGAPVRMKAQGMVMPLTMPFVGKDAFPVLQYYDEVKENRTGVSKAAAGLNADALQSSTQAAVAATVTGAQQHIEVIARLFAEMGVKKLYQKILKLVCQHQQQERVVRLRGTWTAVSPASWNASMDMQVLIGIGEGTNEGRIQTLLGLATKMELFFEKLGPMNPLARVSNYRALLARVLELSGFKDADKFLQPVDPQAEAAAAQRIQQQQQQNNEAQAAQMLAQVQVEQIQADIAMKQADLELKRQELAMKRDLELKRLAQDRELKVLELEMRYRQAVTTAEIQRQMAAESEEARQNAQRQERPATPAGN